MSYEWMEPKYKRLWDKKKNVADLSIQDIRNLSREDLEEYNARPHLGNGVKIIGKVRSMSLIEQKLNLAQWNRGTREFLGLGLEWIYVSENEALIPIQLRTYRPTTPTQIGEYLYHVFGNAGQYLIRQKVRSYDSEDEEEEEEDHRRSMGSFMVKPSKIDYTILRGGG